MPVAVSALMRYLFEGCGESALELRERCDSWCESSPRFSAFVQMHRDKIRKKIRTGRDAEGLRDLQLELDFAYYLIREQRFAVEYEAYLAEKTRGPDFTVRYTTRCTFNVEVRRLRSAPALARWTDVLCDKLRQMPPSSSNLVAIGAGDGAAEFDIGQAMKHMRMLAERKDRAFFQRGGFSGSADFFRAYCRLSGVVLLTGWEASEKRSLSIWVNPQAKHPIAPDVLGVALRALASPPIALG